MAMMIKVHYVKFLHFCHKIQDQNMLFRDDNKNILNGKESKSATFPDDKNAEETKSYGMNAPVILAENYSQFFN